VQAKVPGVQVELAQLMEDLIGDLTAVPQPIEIKLYATDPSVLISQAEKVAAAIGKIDGVVEVKSGVKLAGDALDLRIDPVRAGIEGVTPDDISRSVDAALTGVVATQLPQTTKTVGVRVHLLGALQLRQTALADLPIRASDGHVFPLHRVASLVPVTGQPEVSRDNLQPMIAVTGRIEGRGIGAAVGDVQKSLAQPGLLSSGVRYELGGLYQQQQIAFAGLARVFAAALVAEFILLLFLYERVWLPVIIIACSLLSTTAVFTALWITGLDLNITALMGMTMIIGIGTEMAIFYVSEYAELALEMESRGALREASRNRLHARAPANSLAWAGQAMNKVPQVTAIFWTIKILSTTVGETAAEIWRYMPVPATQSPLPPFVPQSPHHAGDTAGQQAVEIQPLASQNAIKPAQRERQSRLGAI
jgi:multidrug efflux pump subunit AcrB